MKPINKPGLSDKYLISESGEVYSLLRGRYLRGGTQGLPGYLYRTVFLCGKWYSVARLVSLTYLPEPEAVSWRLEINHKDHNKLNNHFSNLEWVSHSENILKAYREGYREASMGMLGKKHREDTRRQMSDGHKKRVKVSWGDNERVFESVGELCSCLGLQRKSYNRHLVSGKPLKGYLFGVVDDQLRLAPIRSDSKKAI